MLKKVVAIHDLSCVGRCSLSVVIPLLSAMGVQACPLPTAVLSSHSGGFKDVVCKNLTEEMQLFSEQWEINKLEFDCVYSGFLASVEQIEITKDFIRKFSKEESLVLVDPVMGDEGKPYSLITAEIIENMRTLIAESDIITPNYTEACFLLKKDYQGGDVNWRELMPWLIELAEMGPQRVVITGIPDKDMILNLGYEKSTGSFFIASNKRFGDRYPGTGDIFASVLLGRLLCEEGFGTALYKAGDFVAEAIEATQKLNLPVREGLAFEYVIESVNL
ncbi:MAG: pyridoxamine kinase [Acidaminococcaceae bacterium]